MTSSPRAAVDPAPLLPSSGAEFDAGREGGRRLRRAGLRVASYRLIAVGPDTVAAVASGHRPPSFGTARNRARRWVRRRVSTPPTLHIGAPSNPTPAAVVEAGGGDVEYALFNRDPRRRVGIIVRDGEARFVVKVARQRGQAERGEREQEVLRRLQTAGLGVHTPVPLGSGSAGALAWSAESRAPGVPLDTTRFGGAGAVAGLLSGIAEWLAQLGAATRCMHDWRTTAHGDESVALRGQSCGLAELLSELDGAPAVLSHGDLATGGNVFVDRDRFMVVDWETSRDRGLPLVDLLPLLCLTAAKAAGQADVDRAADYVLATCRGDTPESAWLFEAVGTYLAEVGVPLALAGRLAALAWGHQASMRLVHEELVRASGLEPVQWRTPADVVAASWMDDAQLGRSWTALAGAS